LAGSFGCSPDPDSIYAVSAALAPTGVSDSVELSILVQTAALEAVDFPQIRVLDSRSSAGSAGSMIAWPYPNENLVGTFHCVIEPSGRVHVAVDIFVPFRDYELKFHRVLRVP
jgi:hypothetical protein